MSAEDVIAAAVGELGKTNGAKYFNYFGYPDLGHWCVAGARWADDVGGCPLPWYSFCAWDDHDVPREHYVGKYECCRLDNISMDFDADSWGDHVGIVLNRQDWGYNTIEFNTGNPGRVDYRQRLFAEVCCGIRPIGGGEPTPSKIAVDGICGHETVKAWQRSMGTTVDGVLSDQLWPHDQFRASVTAIEHYILDYQDWGYQGSSLVRAFQRVMGVDADGDWGYNTTCALQRKLRAWGYYKGDIDGDFGPHSVESLQRSINDKKWCS